MTDAGEIIKSGAGEKIADLVHKLAGPLAEEFGMMLGEWFKVYRTKNRVRTVEKTGHLLREAKLPPNAVPPRLFLPIIDACSVEDNETLQDMWAGLLATASQDTDTVSPSFVETLKQLTPQEARYLQRLHDEALKRKRQYHDGDIWKKMLERNPKLAASDKSVANFPVPQFAFLPVESGSRMSPDTYERLGLIQRSYDVNNKPAGDALADSGYATIYQAELVFQFKFTEYAAKFLQACQGPIAARSESDATAPEPGDYS